MKRGSSTDNSSLELLLDTICNTFGGILFISMLVVTLLNMTSEAVEDSPPSPMTQLELIEAEQQREQATVELDRLRAAVGDQDTVSNLVASAETIRLAKAVGQLQDDHARLVSEKSNAIGQASDLQTDMNRLKQEAEDLAAQLNAAKKQAAALKKEVDDTVADRSKQAVIPKVSQTTLNRATYFLVGGKLYGPLYFPGGAKNTADFMESTISGTTFVDPNPSGGVAVDATGTSLTPIVNKFSRVSAADTYIQLYVWPDSFDHCDAVRKAMESVGLKSDRTPLEDGVRIYFGGATQGPASVQP